MLNKRVCLLIGTHKGGFLLTSDLRRKSWKLSGPFFKGTDVHYVVLDTRTQIIYACVNSTWWGPDIRFSKDLGETWQEPERGIRFPEGGDRQVKRVWYVKPGFDNAGGVLYAGVDPGALFRTTDNGQTWDEIVSLSTHATRDQWSPGFGGLMVHSICPHPEDREKLHVGISAAGTFSTEDGGKTWVPRNKGVLADFKPEKYPEVGQCVHHMDVHPDKPEVLYQQNHCGVYRSDNAGGDWIDLCAGLPSRFGFPLQIHPHEPDTIYVIPEEGPEFRCPVNAHLAVFRSRNRGEQWECLDDGLPGKNAYLNVLRHAMAMDTCDSPGLYFGTSTGQIFASRNEGDSWELLTTWLPPIYSISCAVL